MAHSQGSRLIFCSTSLMCKGSTCAWMDKWIAGTIITQLGDLHYEIDQFSKPFFQWHINQIQVHQEDGAAHQPTEAVQPLAQSDSAPEPPQWVHFNRDCLTSLMAPSPVASPTPQQQAATPTLMMTPAMAWCWSYCDAAKPLGIPSTPLHSTPPLLTAHHSCILQAKRTDWGLSSGIELL